MADYTIETQEDNVVIKSLTKITLQVGDSQIILEPTKVTIEAATIDLSATAQASLKGMMMKLTASASLEVDAPMSQIK